MGKYKDERLKICQDCEHMDCKLLKPARCGVCGCIISIKASIKKEKCPLGKWPDDE